MEAAATFAVDRDARGQRTHWHDAPPVVLRPTGADRLHLLHAAGGPLGGDRLRLTGNGRRPRARLRVGLGRRHRRPAGRLPGSLRTGRCGWTWRQGACLRWGAAADRGVWGERTSGPGLRATVDPDGALVVRGKYWYWADPARPAAVTHRRAVGGGRRPTVDQPTRIWWTAPIPELSGPAGSGGHPRCTARSWWPVRAARPTDERAGRHRRGGRWAVAAVGRTGLSGARSLATGSPKWRPCSTTCVSSRSHNGVLAAHWCSGRNILVMRGGCTWPWTERSSP